MCNKNQEDRISEFFTAFLIIAVVLLLNDYLFADYFGLYEDDYIWVMTLPPMGWSFSDLCHTLRQIWSQWIIYQGRPLGFSLNAIIAYVSGKAASLGFGYSIGYLIMLLNGCLLFKVLRRVLPFAGTLVGALAYITFVPDGAAVILMHRLLHLSMTIVLVAMILYQRRSYILAYLVAAGSLLIYESLYLSFLIAPVLGRDFRKSSRRTFIIHGLLFFGTAGAVLILRSSMGDQRSAMITESHGEILFKVLEACLFGTWACFKAAFYDAFVRAIADSTAITVTMATVGVVVVLALSWERVTRNDPPRAFEISPLLCQYGWIAFGGLIAIGFSYCLSFRAEYFPPIITLGRKSAVHLGAVFGWSMVCGSIFTYFYESRYSARHWIWIVTLCYFGFLIEYGLVLQQTNYVADWRQQASLWKAIISFGGNFEEHEIILLDMDSVPQTPGFDRWGSFGEKSFDALHFFLRFPREWKTPPRIFGLDKNTIAEARSDGIHVHTPYWVSDLWPVIRNESFIYLRLVNGELRAIDGPVMIDGRSLSPKHIDPLKPAKYNVTSIYRKVFRSE
jgi:hypothetical protein